MDAQLQSLLDNLVKTQFADLKGSWANFHLEVPEKVLNDIVNEVLVAQKKNYPLLGLVKFTHVKGSIVLEVKLGV